MPSPPSPSGNRTVLFPGAPFDFPDPIGTARIKYDMDALEWIEEALEPELDKLNDRIAAGRGPVDQHGNRRQHEHDSVWDALQDLSARRLSRITNVLVIAGLAHRHLDAHPTDVDARAAAVRAELGPMPPHLWQHPKLVAAVQRALAHAFGKADDVDPPQAPLPPPAVGASQSAGTAS